MAISKTHILTEIQRTAKANKGVPLGWRRFYAETGIKESDWLGKYWARWGDAVTEAGLTPNALQAGYGEEHLLEQLALLARELGRFPERTDIQLKSRRDKGFPHSTTFQRLRARAPRERSRPLEPTHRCRPRAKHYGFAGNGKAIVLEAA